jgi:hypothetical protein
MLVDERTQESAGRADTASRDTAGEYERHIAETVAPPAGLDVGRLLASVQVAA